MILARASRCGRHFQHLAHLEKMKESVRLHLQQKIDRLGEQGRVKRRDISAPAVTRFDHVHGGKDPQRFTYRRPADAEHSGQVALRGERVAGAQLARDDQRLYGFGGFEADRSPFESGEFACHGGAPSVPCSGGVVVSGRPPLAGPSLTIGFPSTSTLTFDQPLAATEALFPVSSSDVQICTGVVRMIKDDLEVEVHSQPRGVRQGQLPRGRVEVGRPGHEVAGPGLVERVEVLLDQKVRHAGGQLQAHCRCYGTAALMRRDPVAVRRSHRATARVGRNPPKDMGSGWKMDTLPFFRRVRNWPTV